MGLVSEVLNRVCDGSLGVEVSMGSGAGWGGELEGKPPLSAIAIEQSCCQ